MSSFIIIVVIALFIVLVGYTWYRLEAFDVVEKIIFCVAGILLSWLITTILVSLSSRGMNYISVEVENEISNILVLVFTPINGIGIMPYTARIASKLKFEEIKKEEALKQGMILLILLIVIFFVEIKYLTYIQLGIFDIANNM